MRDFNKTVDSLVRAYLDNTLIHGDCSACAVGNIIRSCGYKFDEDPDSLQPVQWLRMLHNKHRYSNHQTINLAEAEEQISITGYSSEELNRIEIAFEKADLGDSNDEWMFNSLMAVVDVLAEIHGIDLSTREEAKKLFVKELVD